MLRWRWYGLHFPCYAIKEKTGHWASLERERLIPLVEKSGSCVEHEEGSDLKGIGVFIVAYHCPFIEHLDMLPLILAKEFMTTMVLNPHWQQHQFPPASLLLTCMWSPVSRMERSSVLANPKQRRKGAVSFKIVFPFYLLFSFANHSLVS
jgi:hypothetical protein